MILSSLVGLYDRLAEGDEPLPGFGFAEVPVVGALTVGADGRLMDILTLLTPEKRGKATKLVPTRLTVPQPPKRTVGISAGFLCDNAGYLLGFDGKGNAERARKTFEAARALHEGLLARLDEPAARRLLAFFAHWRPEDAAAALKDKAEELATGWLVFRDEVTGRYVHDIGAIRRAWEERAAEQDGPRGQCLVTGEEDQPIALTHPAIKGVPGAQSSGAALVSFNQDAFTSYGKSQNLNAPVGARAAFAYTTALNHLTGPHSRYKVPLGDMMVLVFADKATAADVELARALSGFTAPDNDDDDEPATVSPERGAASGVAGMTRIARGTWVDDLNLGPAQGVRIYLLALAPNAARLQIRFFLHDTLGDYVGRLQQHCRDILFTDPATADHVPSFWHLVRELLPRDAEGKPRQDDSTRARLNKLVGDLGRSVLAGHGYPQSLLPLVLDRLRSDGVFTPNRVGLIKAVLNSERRRRADGTPEIPMSVDESIDDIGYVLGRLFAVLENMQEISRGRQGKDQPTIRDRFAGAASTTPGTVFPYLLGLEKAHERKAKRDQGGLAHNLARKIAELMAKIDGAAGFPRRMDPHQQGLFYIGYYHERQSRFAKGEAEAEDQQSDSED
ncbi:type I-C CRISPR-associated protein Cas8c/Csd1 [Zavarzinia aquatilis]|uniref:Type I-C CRISPR-associated protein Cas8c/Csd1 n=1 Tax=Zavarzinia aquatilis TaxID=2211142 RepID=A0A317EDK6_9PROT|nr:type I-C CRISPR-associated protein Cas8c/Csd1 [Zavarzinia aquatilis]PWR24354.1 type I-C CRISPR-associated protein Cas8c/Csd1 [Zavarzinia aquatilis]